MYKLLLGLGLGVSFSSLINVIDSTTTSSTATFTGTTLSTSLGGLSIVENGDYNLINENNNIECTNVNRDKLCLSLTIYNSGDCSDGIETLELIVYGDVESDTNTDLYGIFSMSNMDATDIEYLSFFSDWSGGFGIPSTPTINGGVAITPHCELTSLLSIDDTGNDNNWPNTLLDDCRTAYQQRQVISGGDYNNWESLTTSKVGEGTSPLKYKIVNNHLSNEMTVYFDLPDESDFFGVSCNYPNIFDGLYNNNDYVIAFGSDQGTIEFTQIDVTLTCEIPTSEPTATPTKGPTTSTISSDDSCLGCSAGGSISYGDCYAMGTIYNFDESDYGIFACYGTFSGGMDDSSVDSICGNNYHVCDSATEASELGLTVNECITTIDSNEIFFLREGGNPAGACESESGESSYNDAWGCSGGITSDSLFYGGKKCIYIEDSSYTFDNCQPLTHVCGVWHTDDYDYDTSILDLGSQLLFVYDNVALNDANYGGVLCCKDDDYADTYAL